MSAAAVRWRTAAGALLSVALLGQPGPALLRAQAPTFDSGRAFEHVRQLVAIGPRPAGSAGAVQARRYVTRQLSSLGLTAAEQSFVAQTPPGPVPMANLVARIPGARAERLILASHYDTKLFRDFRFVGANDGASSTALLLELARVLRARKNPFTIDLVFFDGEESVIEWTGTDHTYGSRHYVEAAQRDGSIRSVRAMVLFDMVGDRQLTIKRETDSTPWLTDLIWAAARRRNEPAFLAEDFAVEDDHRPFLDAGVPAVNIIDLDYDAWHTKDDTLDRVSARSLQTVADVFLDALPQIEKRLRR